MLRKLLALLILLSSLLFIYQYVCHCTDNDCDQFLPREVTQRLSFLNVSGQKAAQKNRGAVDADKNDQQNTDDAKTAKKDSIPVQPLIIKDGGALVLRLEGEDNFKFPTSTSTPVINEKAKRNIVDSFNKYLRGNPQKGIEIIGGYARNEKNDTEHEDIGIARAESLKQQLVMAGLPATKVQTTSRLYPTPNIHKDTLLGGIDFNFIKIQESLVIKDEDKTLLDAEGHFKFAKNTHRPIMNDAVNNGLKSVGNYLRNNPNKTLEVVGEYTNEEENDTDLPNLGMARANSIKKILISTGSPSDKVKLGSKLNPELTFDNDTLFGGISITVATTDSTATDSTGVAAKTDSTATDSTKTAAKTDSTATDSTKTTTKADSTATDSTKTAAKVDNSETEKEDTTKSDDKKEDKSGGKKVDEVAKQEAAENENNAKKTPPPPALQIKDADQTVSESRDAIGFAPSSAKPILTNNIKRSLREVKAYLQKNPNRELVISGKYSADEKNDSGKPSLGIARAEAIKKELLSVGTPANKLKTREQRIASVGKEDTLTNLLDFNFRVSKKVEKDLLNLSRTLYFDKGSDQLKLDADLKKYFKNVKTYLEQTTNKRLQLTGHTDSDGEEAKNMELGKSRAEKVKQELVKMNIPTKKIITLSKGEKQPLKPNTTDAGKKANRRVEVIIK